MKNSHTFIEPQSFPDIVNTGLSCTLPKQPLGDIRLCCIHAPKVHASFLPQWPEHQQQRCPHRKDIELEICNNCVHVCVCYQNENKHVWCEPFRGVSRHTHAEISMRPEFTQELYNRRKWKLDVPRQFLGVTGWENLTRTSKQQSLEAGKKQRKHQRRLSIHKRTRSNLSATDNTLRLLNRSIKKNRAIIIELPSTTLSLTDHQSFLTKSCLLLGMHATKWGAHSLNTSSLLDQLGKGEARGRFTPERMEPNLPGLIFVLIITNAIKSLCYFGRKWDRFNLRMANLPKEYS